MVEFVRSEFIILLNNLLGGVNCGLNPLQILSRAGFQRMKARRGTGRTERTCLKLRPRLFRCTNYRGPLWTMRSRFLEGRNWMEATWAIWSVQPPTQPAGSQSNTKGNRSSSKCRSTCWYLGDMFTRLPQKNYYTSRGPGSHPNRRRLRKSWMAAS